MMLSGPIYLERAAIAQRMGRAEQATAYYHEFLRRVDRPTVRYRRQVQEVGKELRALSEDHTLR